MTEWLTELVTRFLAALFAVDVTDLVVDWRNAWLGGWLC